MSRWIISLLLVALCVRALVPVGYMPSAERPFSFQICPDGFPAELLQRASPAQHHHDAHAHHQMGGGEEQAPDHPGAAKAEHCVFAVAASAGPAPESFLLGPSPPAFEPAVAETAVPVFSHQRYRIPQSRAPPIFS